MLEEALRKKDVQAQAGAIIKALDEASSVEDYFFDQTELESFLSQF